MMDSTSVSRRGMFQNMLALLAACAAWPNRRPHGATSVAGGAGEHDRGGSLYWEFDEYGRVVLVVDEGPRPSSTAAYYY
jgi:hypothetical protein